MFLNTIRNHKEDFDKQSTKITKCLPAYQLQGSLPGVEGGEGHQGSKVRDGTRHQQLTRSEGEAGHEVTCAEEHRYVCPWIDTDGDKVTVARDENLDIALDEMTVLVREKKKKKKE